MPTSLVVNGKFLSSTGSGVHRVAEELIRALDALLEEEALATILDIELLVPPGPVRTLPLNRIRVRACGRLRKRAWEQIDLPRHAAGRLVLNLCNLGPVACRNAVTMIHDAQVRSTPDSYSPAFRAWYRLIQPLLGRRHRLIATVSEFSRTELVRFGIAPASRIRVVHNGVDHMDRVVADPETCRRLDLPSGGHVLALASTQPHKNLRVLIEAFERMPGDGPTLALFGAQDADDFARAGLRPGPRVRFLGRLDDGELKALMTSAHALAFPSTTEGFGLPPLEAMRVGCPVIVAPEGALPEVCGDAALYAAADDPGAWCAALRTLSADAAVRAARIEAGRRHAARFTWAASARTLLGLLGLLGLPGLPGLPGATK